MAAIQIDDALRAIAVLQAEKAALLEALKSVVAHCLTRQGAERRPVIIEALQTIASVEGSAS